MVKKNKIILVFQSSYDHNDKSGIGEHVKKHGDGVRDIAFTVEDCKKTFEVVKKRGVKVIMEPKVLKDDQGEVIIARIWAFNDTVHTFVERKNYKGCFMPNFRPHHIKEVFNTQELETEMINIDHIVSNHGEKDMEPTA